MSFPTKSEREACWQSRDKYWECLDLNADEAKQCLETRSVYENLCPAQWVKHFDRKRKYLQFKEKIEKEGYDPVEAANWK
ncbi:cytochrome c oxidase assembly factor 6 homolog isoform X2 [Nilaparvata lugens]|uniref:cytochrome c oxidase assembly factor 6 homolog isoform X2 n=1 Tax=Nilaparvata lugens TaxID=108931 RepID=UPI000B987982|nr:cytochrome c oxidase assembly factor 6 homolog isoform X2 [Nilaparvata lugens]XP_039293913.1 cytochrome c oxidase assembly factor 6 homolog isoform X2 [Nilaparvata lugens]